MNLDASPVPVLTRAAVIAELRGGFTVIEIARRHQVARRKVERLRSPEQYAAHNAVYCAVKSGRLVRPERCSKCGVLCKTEAHHEDYLRPLDVVWLCPPCHTKLRKRLAVP